MIEPSEQRLRILEPKEINDIFGLPLFSKADQQYFFSMSMTEQLLIERQRLPKNRLLMMIQLGYFKAKQPFFDFTWENVSSDVKHLQEQYFQDDQLSLEKLPDCKTKFNQQKQILIELKHHRFTQPIKESMNEKACELAQSTTQPAQLLRHLLKILHVQRIVIPSYRTFQDIISHALSYERKRIKIIFNDSLPQRLSQQLKIWLEENRSEETMLSKLKQEPKNFKFTSIKNEISNKEILTPLYPDLSKIIQTLNISAEYIQYYASLLSLYTVSRLVQLKKESQFLIVICFLYLRYQKINDHLIDALRVNVNSLQKDAKIQAKESVLEYKLDIENRFGEVGQILNLFTDKEIDNGELFGDIRNLAFDCLSAKDLDSVIDYINQRSPSSKEFEWEALTKLYNAHKPILRAILRTLDLSYQANDSLAKAVSFFNSIEKISSVKSTQWPIQWIPARQKSFIYDESGVIYPVRWEILLFIRLKARIASYNIWVNDSQDYRNIEDELLSDQELENKDDLIEKYQIPILKNSAENHLNNLQEELESLYIEVNDSIKSGHNNYFKTYQHKGDTRWTLNYNSKEQENDHTLLRQLNSSSIFEVMHYTNNACQWSKAFFHKKSRYNKSSLEMGNLFASILAIGTALGLNRMSKISDLSYSDIKLAYKNFLRCETLYKANEIISDATAELSFFNNFDINGLVHSSSDGQHYQTQYDTMKSQHLPKYFGLKKGIVVYALIANHVPINAEVIGTHDHESHFVFDLIYNNATQIKPKLHSTDSHGVNSLNFSLLHFFGYQFAPRYKNIRKQSNRIIGFNKLSEYPDDYLIKPSRKIRSNHIIKNWDTINRIILSLGSRKTRQSTLVRKLSALPDNHSLKSGLNEYNLILE